MGLAGHVNAASVELGSALFLTKINASLRLPIDAEAIGGANDFLG